jgi:uncharacterized protein YndB with AHSA1/START domain
MSAHETGLDMRIEVPGTPEQVWDAIATGPGISAWFMAAEIDGDRMTFHHMPGGSSEARITDAQAPRRLRFVEGPDDEMAHEFLVEAQSGGTCVVRLVTNFGDKGASDGWTAALLGLRLYLEHFAGQEAANVSAGGRAAGPVDRAWAELQASVGLDDPPEGARVTARGEGVPPLAGVVEGRLETMAILRLEEPARGLGFIGVGGPDDETVFAIMRAQFFGPGAAEVAARDEPLWRALLAERVGVST